MATVTTLPATFVSGAVLTAAQMNDLRGAFRVLQIVSGATITATASSSTTIGDTTLTATITPSATSSKVLVLVNHPACFKSNQNSQNAVVLELWRDDGKIVTITGEGGYTNSLLEVRFGLSGLYMDSPASVAALVYKTRFANLTADAQVIVQNNGNASSIILMEISA